MKLENSTDLTIEKIAADQELAIQVQTILIKLNLLSGTADGQIGPQSKSALVELSQITKSDLTPQLLLQIKSLPQPEINFSKGDFAAKIAKYILSQNYWIDANHLNIVYVEGCNPDGTPNDDAMNEWNDLVRFVA